MRLARQDYLLISNPLCLRAVENLDKEDFQYFDKDGFELNQAERKFYSAMQYPINHPILNHVCWQEPWFELEDDNLFLDHSLILHRCSYAEYAFEQLTKISKEIPQARMLLQAKQKWGYDFDLNATAPSGEVFEVLHIEHDGFEQNHWKANFLIGWSKSESLEKAF